MLAVEAWKERLKVGWKVFDRRAAVTDGWQRCLAAVVEREENIFGQARGWRGRRDLPHYLSVTIHSPVHLLAPGCDRCVTAESACLGLAHVCASGTAVATQRATPRLTGGKAHGAHASAPTPTEQLEVMKGTYIKSQCGSHHSLSVSAWRVRRGLWSGRGCMSHVMCRAQAYRIVQSTKAKQSTQKHKYNQMVEESMLMKNTRLSCPVLVQHEFF